MFYIVLLDPYHATCSLTDQLQMSLKHSSSPTNNKLSKASFVTPGPSTAHNLVGIDEISLSVALSSSQALYLLLAPSLSTNSPPNG